LLNLLTKALPATFKVEVKIKEGECLFDIHIARKNNEIMEIIQFNFRKKTKTNNC